MNTQTKKGDVAASPLEIRTINNHAIDYFIRFNPVLASNFKKLGYKNPADMALIATGIRYWLNLKSVTGRIVEGIKWIYNPVATILDDRSSWAEYFSWLSAKVIRKCLAQLEGLGLIRSRHFDGQERFRREKLYTLNEDMWATLHQTAESIEKSSICPFGENAFSPAKQLHFPSVGKYTKNTNQRLLIKDPVCVSHEHTDLEKGEGQEELSDRFLEAQPDLEEILQDSRDSGEDKYSAAPAEILSAVAPELEKLAIDPSDRGLGQRVANLAALVGLEKAIQVVQSSLSAIAAMPAPRCPVAALKTAIAEGGWVPTRRTAANNSSAKTPDELLERQTNSSGQIPVSVQLQQNPLRIPADKLRAFQEALEVYARGRNYQSPGSYALKVISNLSAGLKSPLWDDFEAGRPLGEISVQREWDITPGVPYPAFEEERIQYYVQKFGEPIEAAVAKARKDLRDPVLGKDLWDGFLRKCDRLADEGLKAKELGVATPYLPPSFGDRVPVSKESVMAKMEAVAPSVVPQLPGNAERIEEPTAIPTLDKLNELCQTAIGRNLVEGQIAQNPEWGYAIVGGEVVENPAPRTLKVRVEGMLNAGNFAIVLIRDLWRSLSNECDRNEVLAALRADKRGMEIANALAGGGL